MIRCGCQLVSGCGDQSWPRRPVPTVCRILCSNVRGLARNHSDLTVASSQYDILLCSETLALDMRHLSEILVPGFGRPILLCRGKMPWARGMAAYVRDGYGAFCQPKFECGCCEMLVFKVCGGRQNLYVFSLTGTLTQMTGFLIVYQNQWLPCRLRIFVPLSCLWEI